MLNWLNKIIFDVYSEMKQLKVMLELFNITIADRYRRSLHQSIKYNCNLNKKCCFSLCNIIFITHLLSYLSASTKSHKLKAIVENHLLVIIFVWQSSPETEEFCCPKRRKKLPVAKLVSTKNSRITNILNLKK